MTTPTGLPKIGRYSIVREIARSNDIVWEGYDSQMNRRVAVKELVLDQSLSGAAKRQRIERFYREARAAGTMNHPNIVTIHEVGEDNGRYFIAMEYLEGQTLRSRLDIANALPVNEAIKIASDLCDALEYAHTHSIIHRDIKPDNIHLIPGNRVKLTDFGIARITTESQLTIAGQVFGTPSYMSPEQVIGRDIDHRSDIFSLGIVLYEMITGRKPFTGESVVTITYRILNDPTPPLLGASPALDSVIRRATAKDPSERYVSAAEFRAALHLALEQRTRQTIMPGTMVAPPSNPGYAPAGVPRNQPTAHYGAQTQIAAAPFPTVAPSAAPITAPIPAPPLMPYATPATPPRSNGRIASILLALVIGGGIAVGTGWMLQRAYKTAIAQTTINQFALSLNKGIELYNQSKYQEAAAIFKGLRDNQATPDETRKSAAMYEGYCYIQLGNNAKLSQQWDNARFWYTEAVKVSPNDPVAAKSLKDLESFLAQNRPNGTPTTTIPSDGTNPPAALPSANTRPNTPPPSQSAWFQKNQAGANEAAMLVQRGNEAYNVGNYKQAAHYWNQAVSTGAGTQAAQEALQRLQQLQSSN